MLHEAYDVLCRNDQNIAWSHNTMPLFAYMFESCVECDSL